jgi:hypothetical protein
LIFKREKDAFFFMKNMLGKILGFDRMQQKIYIYIYIENALIFFFEKLWRQPGILIPDLYFTV